MPGMRRGARRNCRSTTCTKERAALVKIANNGNDRGDYSTFEVVYGGDRLVLKEQWEVLKVVSISLADVDKRLCWIP